MKARVLVPATVYGYDDAHANLVEVAKQSDGRYTLRLFNITRFDPRQHAIVGATALVPHTGFVNIPPR